MAYYETINLVAGDSKPDIGELNCFRYLGLY